MPRGKARLRTRQVRRKTSRTAAKVAAETAAIKSVLGDYITAVENADLGLYGKIVSHDPEAVNFGTDASDRIVGWDALRKVMEAQFAALKETRITASDVTVNIAPGGRFAWATSLWDFKAKMGEQEVALPVRCTWVLEKAESRWVIVHFHKSVGTTA
jgi:ketosteroid isomerase-like protein